LVSKKIFSNRPGANSSNDGKLSLGAFVEVIHELPGSTTGFEKVGI
jgi:hypothetical protein